MPPALPAVAFAVGATVLEIGLVVFGAPLLIIIVAFLVIIATGFLLVSWHPAAVVASLAIYAFAVILGLVGFSLLDLGLSVI